MLTLKVTIPSFKYSHAFEEAHPKTAIAQVKLYIFLALISLKKYWQAEVWFC